MTLIKSVRGFTPQIGENTYLSENATIVGDVTIGRDCSIWFNAVLRGDVNPIRIGDRVNIQDGSVLHTLYERSVVEMLNDEELKCLNDYHEMVYNRLSIYLNEEEQAWLKAATSPLKR